MSVAATLERFAATMPRAAADEIDVARVRLFGVRGWVAYRPDHDQRRLRQAHAIGPGLGFDLLDRSKGLRAASRFAMYCRRLLVIPELPPNQEVALAEASFYGIGVALRRNGTVTMVLEPEPFTDWQPTAAWWWFTEEVYRGAAQAR